MKKNNEATASPPRKVRYLLFADVVGFSKLPEHAVPRYITHFLGGVARLLDTEGFRPLARNTWGDAIYLVYDSLTVAAKAALALQHWCKGESWHALLKVRRSTQLKLRLGLHAGPVFEMKDPVIGQDCFMGRNTSLAARLEPIAEEGQILASEEFAALAALRGNHSFRLEYVGIRPLPKQSGSHAVYLLLPGSSTPSRAHPKQRRSTAAKCAAKLKG